VERQRGFKKRKGNTNPKGATCKKEKKRQSNRPGKPELGTRVIVGGRGGRGDYQRPPIKGKKEVQPWSAAVTADLLTKNRHHQVGGRGRKNRGDTLPRGYRLPRLKKNEPVLGHLRVETRTASKRTQKRSSVCDGGAEKIPTTIWSNSTRLEGTKPMERFQKGAQTKNVKKKE